MHSAYCEYTSNSTGEQKYMIVALKYDLRVLLVCDSVFRDAMSTCPGKWCHYLHFNIEYL